MFQEHEVFSPPPDGQQTLWRYVDFGQFVNMLQTSALWFSSTLDFEDEFEGSYPTHQMEMNRAAITQQMIEAGRISEVGRADGTPPDQARSAVAGAARTRIPDDIPDPADGANAVRGLPR